MHIKVGDIVRYGGVNQRIMMRGQYISRLSTYGVIDNSLCHLDLVESMTLPHLEVGDWVLVNNIPIQEKNAYPTPWYGGCEEIITSGHPHQIEAIYNTIDYGRVIKIDEHMFLPYHLTPTNSYDMI